MTETSSENLSGPKKGDQVEEKSTRKRPVQEQGDLRDQKKVVGRPSEVNKTTEKIYITVGAGRDQG